MKDITTINDIELLVNTFYKSVQHNTEIGPIFNSIIGKNWDRHIQKMVQFWQTILLDAHTYKGSPFTHHRKLPLKKKHFDAWLELFFTTIDQNFSGKNANEAKIRATNMARIFLIKLNKQAIH